MELWLRPGTNFIASEWTVSVYAGSTRQALTTDASSISYLPNASGKYTTYFDAAASTAYTVRFCRVNNAGVNAGVLNVANVIVGPGIQPQGAVVGPAIAYTPTISGVGTATAVNIASYTAGTRITVSGQFTTGTTAGSQAQLTLPNSWTIKTPGSATRIAGKWWLHNNSVSSIKNGSIICANGNTYVTFGSDDYVNGQYPDTSLNGSTLFNNTSVVFVEFTVEVNELAGSGTVNLAQNDVEYAFNTGNVTTAGATDSTHFGYGPAGTPILAIDSVSSSNSTSFLVQFQTPLQNGDKTELELSTDVGATWIPWVWGFIRQSTYLHGARIVGNNSTSVQVQFMNGGYDGSLTTFGAAGEPWSNLSGYRWRVRRSSGGQAVGFGIVNPGASSGLVAAAGLPGNTTGNAIATGYVGEVVTFGESLALTSSGTTTGANHSLAAGTWLIFATTSFSNSGTITAPGLYLYIDGANSSTLSKDFYSDQVTHGGALNFPGPGFVSTYSKSSSFNISARITCGVNTGASFVFVSFTAVRIA